ncbi:hypothetical protein [Parahaliea mediterranea]|uniref:hypothetical protein n=1 Tax=Parahaliea mediterranea TaxID=651086 RepID=UPI0013003ECE|nr:hypothetical protein [Parahaliea mediterranea]
MDEEMKEKLLQELENAANFLRGMTFDPRLDPEIRSAVLAKATWLDDVVQEHLD